MLHLATRVAALHADSTAREEFTVQIIEAGEHPVIPENSFHCYSLLFLVVDMALNLASDLALDLAEKHGAGWAVARSRNHQGGFDVRDLAG